MNGSELRAAIERLQKKADKVSLRQRWREFQDAAVNSWQNPRTRQPISDQFAALTAALDQVDLSQFPVAEQRALETLGVSYVFGAPAIEELEEIAFAKDFDPAGAAQKLQRLNARVDRVFELLERTAAVLDEAGIKATLVSRGSSLQVIFAHRSEISSVVDLTDAVKSWDLIFHAFARLVDIRPEDLKVSTISKASPLVIDVTAPIEFIGAVGSVCAIILVGLERYLRVKRALLEIKAADLGNQKAELEIEEKTEQLRKRAAEEAAAKAIADHGKKPDGEIRNGLTIAIDKLYLFIEKGGEVSARLPDASTAPEEQKAVIEQITHTFDEIRRVEAVVEQRLLGNGAPPAKPPK